MKILDLDNITPLYPNPLTGEMQPAPKREDDEAGAMVFKSTFRFTIDFEREMVPASRWRALGNLLLSIRYGSWRGVRHYARVVWTGRSLRGVIWNAGV